MRLRTLDLIRYGKFTDHTIDFGAHPGNQPDFHIIYGPNESGKTTALSAFLDLLYGIERKSAYDFLHEYSVMRIGAQLELDGKIKKLRRVKRNQNSLLDGDDRPVAEQVLQQHLGGIDRDTYRAMFSLDDDTLEAGGESILASEGDLGELLFSATAGLAGLSATLSGLRAEAEQFYRPHARNTRLVVLKGSIAELKAQREALDTAASAYAQLVDTVDRHKALYEVALEERATIRTRMDEIRRTISALPRFLALHDIRQRLRPLAALPAAPPGWQAAMPDLHATDITLAVKLDTANKDIDRRTRELEAMQLNDAALGLAGRVAAWTAEYAEAFSAELHTPDRQAELLAENLTIAGILGRLGQAEHTDPQSLLLQASTTGKLRQLIIDQSGIQARLEGATAELEAAQRALSAAQEACKTPDDDTASAGDQEACRAAVRVALTAIQDDGVIARLRDTAAREATSLDSLNEALATLLPWCGDLATLAMFIAPEKAELLSWRDDLTNATLRVEQRADELASRQTERRLKQSQLDALSGVIGITNEVDAASIRGERERAWSNHRQVLNESSANTFEHALRRDDIVTAARVQHAADVATLQQLQQALALMQTSETLAEEGLESARDALEAQCANLRASIAALTPELPATTSLPQLEAWLAKREQALSQGAAWRQARRDAQTAQANAEAARSRLAGAMMTAGLAFDPDSDVAALTIAAQEVMAREGTRLAALQTRRAEERNVATREANLAKIKASQNEWCAEWAAVCRACWLGDLPDGPSVAAVQAILDALGDLAPALDRRAVLARRITDMTAKQNDFAREVAEAASVLNLNMEGASPLATARTMMQTVQDAVAAKGQAAAKRQSLNEQLEAQQALRRELALHEARRAEMTAFFGVESLADAAARLVDAQRKIDLEAEAAQAEREIAETMLAADFAATEILLANADRPALDRELTGLQARFDDLDRRTQDLFAQYSKATDEVAAVGGDGEAARLDAQRRIVLLDIEDSALRYLKLRTGIIAAEHALLAYRQQHRSSMMARASDAFEMISRRAYRGLVSQPKRDGGEELIALSADGSSKLAKCLSKGTRFQLYLALRVAGYHEFAATRDTVPFIADDIMETFDDFRAEEALRVFADMASSGQVIYLTHHRHLCEIAGRICPGVRVHQLGERPEA
jgi:uncharacterized protein YhaN